MTWDNLSWAIQSYLDMNFSYILSWYLYTQSWYIEKAILQSQSILQLQHSNIDFWYNHIQTILWWLAIVGIVLFLWSYGYIWTQAKQAIDKIEEEKKRLEEQYSKLLEQTGIDITKIKENNNFQILLMKGLTLKANKKREDALDHYDNMLAQQFI